MHKAFSAENSFTLDKIDVSEERLRSEKLLNELAPIYSQSFFGSLQQRVIAIASGKGGVGKSTIAAAIACEAARLGKHVALIEADVGGENTAIILNTDKLAKGEHRKLAPNLTLYRTWLQGTDIDDTQALVENMVTIFGPPWINEEGIPQPGGAEFNQYGLVILDIGAGVHLPQTIYSYLFPRIGMIVTPEATSIQSAYSFMKIVLSRHNLSPLDFMIIANRVEDAVTGTNLGQTLAKVVSEHIQPQTPLARLETIGNIPYDKRLDARNGLPKHGSIANMGYPSIKAIAQILIELARTPLKQEQR